LKDIRNYKVGKKSHSVYRADYWEAENKKNSSLSYKEDWKEGEIGDWVKTDDDHVVQILRKNKVGDTWTVGTCTGTYLISGSSSMDSIRKKDIYSVSGKNWYTRIKDRKDPTKKEILFAAKVGLGEDPTEAYLAIYDTEDKDQARKKAGILVKTERIQKLMNEKLKDTFSKNAIDLDYLIKSCKDVVDGGKNDSDRLKALNMLWDAYGVVEKQKVTEVRGVFQGFQPEQIEQAGRSLLGTSKKDED
jgi:hypothetical protein